MLIGYIWLFISLFAVHLLWVFFFLHSSDWPGTHYVPRLALSLSWFSCLPRAKIIAVCRNPQPFHNFLRQKYLENSNLAGTVSVPWIGDCPTLRCRAVSRWANPVLWRETESREVSSSQGRAGMWTTELATLNAPDVTCIRSHPVQNNVAAEFMIVTFTYRVFYNRYIYNLKPFYIFVSSDHLMDNLK